MEEEKAEAMLRQLIGHFQELYDLFVSRHATPFMFSSSPATNLHRLPQLHPQNHLLLHRNTRYDFEDDSAPIVELMNGPDLLPLAKKSRGEHNHGKRTGQTSSLEVMEHHIWKEFPEDLLEAVIAKIPIPTFFLFRSVCKKWNSLLSSHTFSQLCAEVSQSQPWFYSIINDAFPCKSVNVGVIYDPSAEKWRHLPAPSLPLKIALMPVASAGGLVCSVDFGYNYFYVCNPLTQTWKQLPARTVKDQCRVSVGMVLNGKSATEGYKILWVSHDGDFEVYDSMKNSWTRPGNMPQNIKLPLCLNIRSHFRSQTSHGVSSNSSIYFLLSEPHGIMSYDMVSGVWKQFPVPTPPNSSDHTLAVCGDRIMLAGLLKRNAVTCVCVWELQKMTLLWKEVDRMPNIWCLEFYGKHVRMNCLGNKGMLMLSLRCKEMNQRWRNLIVTYDISKREWSEVSACVFPGARKPILEDVACVTEFYPCLTAVP